MVCVHGVNLGVPVAGSVGTFRVHVVGDTDFGEDWRVLDMSDGRDA